MRRVWEATLNLLYPPTCCACGRPTERPGFCRMCRTAIETPGSPLCPVCAVRYRTPGVATGADHLCGHCLARHPYFGQARACSTYDAAETVSHPLKSVLQRYKYNP